MSACDTTPSDSLDNGPDSTSDTTSDSSSDSSSAGPISVSSLTISAVGSPTSLRANSTLQLAADVLPSNADDKSVAWSSSAESIATVSEAGLVSGVSMGDVTITATSVSKTSVSNTYVLSVLGYSASWPTSLISTFLGAEIATEIPSASSASGYYYSEFNDLSGTYASDFYIEMDGDDAAVETSYIAILESAKYRISDLNYDSYGYECIDQYLTVEVDVKYSAENGILTVYIYRYADLYGEAPEISAAWPAEAVAAYLGESVTTSVPSFVSEDLFYYYELISEDDGPGYLVITSPFASIEGETTYSASLTSAGWTIDDSEYDTVGLVAVDAAEQVQIIYYYYEGEMLWAISAYVPSGTGGVAVDGVATFDLTTEDELIVADAEESVWSCTPVTMTISKGASTIAVGNGTYFSDPLRVYTAQVVTFAVSAENVIDSVVITAGSSAYATVIGNSTIVGGSIAVSASVATITADAGVSEIILTLSAQSRWNEAIVNFSPVED